MVTPCRQRSHYRCRVAVLKKIKVLHTLAAISLGLRRRLWLGLRGIADGFGQHLAQLSFGLLRFPVWGLCHAEYVEMPEGVLNPDGPKSGINRARPTPPLHQNRFFLGTAIAAIAIVRGGRQFDRLA